MMPPRFCSYTLYPSKLLLLSLCRRSKSGMLINAYSGFWIVLPAYMLIAFGRDLLQGLIIASGDSSTIVTKSLPVKEE